MPGIWLRNIKGRVACIYSAGTMVALFESADGQLPHPSLEHTNDTVFLRPISIDHSWSPDCVGWMPGRVLVSQDVHRDLVRKQPSVTMSRRLLMAANMAKRGIDSGAC